MTSDIVLDSTFSKMSLAVAKDSSWYVVNMQKGSEYLYGKNKGCQIFENTCNPDILPELCQRNDGLICSDDHKYISTCKKSKFSDSCKKKLKIVFCKKRKQKVSFIDYFGHYSMCHNMEVIITFLFNFR